MSKEDKTFTNIEVVAIYNSLRSKEVAELELSFEATIALEKNTRRLAEYVSEIQNIEKRMKKVPDAILEMDELKKAEAAPYLVKDESGNVVISPQGEVEIIDEPGFKEKFIEIANKYNNLYRKDIEKYNSKLSSWNDFYFNGKADVKLERIKAADIDFPPGKKIKKGPISNLLLIVDLDLDDNTESDTENKDAGGSSKTEE